MGWTCFLREVREVQETWASLLSQKKKLKQTPLNTTSRFLQGALRVDDEKVLIRASQYGLWRLLIADGSTTYLLPTLTQLSKILQNPILKVKEGRCEEIQYLR